MIKHTEHPLDFSGGAKVKKKKDIKMSAWITMNKTATIFLFNAMLLKSNTV